MAALVQTTLHAGVVLTVVFVLVSIVHSLTMFALSFREPRRWRRPAIAPSPAAAEQRGPANDDLFFVFMAPCLNEEAVIGNSIERMLALGWGNMAFVVVNDGSDDATAAIVDSYDDPRVHLITRTFPEARHGKGEALNYALGRLRDSELLAGRDPRQVIIAVVDADGRLEADTLAAVTRSFERPEVGAVQIGVRINNRHQSLLARMQDVEFVIFTSVFQRGRRHLGSVGLGGNGQFMRLAALNDLGATPWSRSLTEDLDLGVRLLMLGWANEFCSEVSVHQQGLSNLRRLVRQRTRWFQGGLQAWNLLPLIAKKARPVTAVDLTYQITAPALLLTASLMSASFLLGLAAGVSELVSHPVGVPWAAIAIRAAVVYLLGFGVMLVLASRYWQAEKSSGARPWQVVLWAHCYVIYVLLWYFAGWRALWRMLTGAKSWAKTARHVETAATTQVPDALPAPTPISSRPLPAGLTDRVA